MRVWDFVKWPLKKTLTLMGPFSGLIILPRPRFGLNSSDVGLFWPASSKEPNLEEFDEKNWDFEVISIITDSLGSTKTFLKPVAPCALLLTMASSCMNWFSTSIFFSSASISAKLSSATGPKSSSPSVKGFDPK